MSNFYLYLITDGIQDPPIQLKGIKGNDIRSMCCREVYVWFSPMDDNFIPQTLDNCKIHNKVALEAMNWGTVLPFQFGTIVQGEETVCKIVNDVYIKVAENLSKLSGKIEVGIKVFGKIAEEKLVSPEDSVALERLSSVKRKTQSVNYLIDKVRVSQRERAMEQYIRQLSDVLFAPLKMLAEDSKITKTQHEKMLINASFLIKKEDLAPFRMKVDEIKSNHAQYSFLYSGPWPPYNFVKIIKEGA